MSVKHTLDDCVCIKTTIKNAIDEWIIPLDEYIFKLCTTSAPGVLVNSSYISFFYKNTKTNIKSKKSNTKS